MFDNYVGAKTRKRRAWVSALIGTSVVVHVVVFSVLYIQGLWVIDKVPLPKGGVFLSVAPPPPPPPPPPPAGKKREPRTKKVKVKLDETVQPIKKDEDEEVDYEIVDQADLDEGVEGGVAGGVAGGVIGGTLDISGAPPPPPPPPPPAPPPPPQVVPQQAIEAQRISGEKQIVPDEPTKIQISRSGQSRIVTTVKMCLSGSGNVSSLSVLKASGFPAYDRKIKAKMRQWKYQPFKVNGKPVPVCTSVTFIYSQS
jgi:protein TonB